MAVDFGDVPSVGLWSDVSAAIAISQRSGPGKLRHIQAQYLWLQERVSAKDISLTNVLGTANPADMLTKHLARSDLDRHLAFSGLSLCAGRPEGSLQVSGVSGETSLACSSRVKRKPYAASKDLVASEGVPFPCLIRVFPRGCSGGGGFLVDLAVWLRCCTRITPCGALSALGGSAPLPLSFSGRSPERDCRHTRVLAVEWNPCPLPLVPVAPGFLALRRCLLFAGSAGCFERPASRSCVSFAFVLACAL